jgi:serine/threonine protein phosphatase PrpC
LTTNHKTKVWDCSHQSTAWSDILIGEKARISAAGGFVDFGRVNGNLALSRAIGDFEFKKSADLSPEQQIVTAFPDVITHEISSDDEFLVIACDGEIYSNIRHAEYLCSMCRYMGLSVFPGSC